MFDILPKAVCYIWNWRLGCCCCCVSGCGRVLKERHGRRTWGAVNMRAHAVRLEGRKSEGRRGLKCEGSRGLKSKGSRGLKSEGNRGLKSKASRGLKSKAKWREQQKAVEYK